jgi:uncharacterized protein (DUF58 family)
VTADVRTALDWGKLVPLRLRARSVADGVYAGGHRSPRRGGGVEFGGHRSYVPGDDLRFIDRHALMRHGRLLVREFETETDRTLRLVMDASASMAYKSELGPATKLEFAAVVAAALARIAVAGGDPTALDWIGGRDPRRLPSMGGREGFERIVGALEDAEAGGDLRVDISEVDRAIAPVARHARRGSVIVLLSDLIDLPEGTLDRLAALATRGRTVVALRVLDPMEARFPLEGPLRLRALEGDLIIETDAQSAREQYLRALDALAESWDRRLLHRGGRLVRAVTDEDPVSTVRAVLEAAEGRRP